MKIFLDGVTNLIDFNSEPAPAPKELDYVNVVPSSNQIMQNTTNSDVFDLSEFYYYLS